MSVTPTTPEDDSNAALCANGHQLQSSTLPPVLFELPNLSASPCADADAVADNEAEESVDQGAASDTDSEIPIFEPVPLASASPQPQTTPQPVAKAAVEPQRESDLQPTTAPPTTTPPKTESAFDIWGTRAVVVTLLLLVIGSAFIAASKSGGQADQPVAEDSSEMSSDDLTALEGFAVSEGVADADTAVEKQSVTPSDFTALLADSDREPTVDADNVAAVATLDAPITEENVDAATGHQPTESPAMEAVASAKSDAAFGPAERVSATTASSRTETMQPREVLKPADEIPVIPVIPATSETGAVGPQIDLPADLQSVAAFANQTEAAAEDLTQATPSAPVVTPETDSGAIRYSSTPNGIADWDQYYEWMKSRIKTQTPEPPTN